MTESLEDKYENEDYRLMMKAFADAATIGDIDQLKHGLNIGADINGLGEKWTGWTALHHAADAGHAPAVTFLLEAGADIDKYTLDYANHTALHLAVTKRFYDVVDILLAAGVNTEVYTKTSCGGTALHLAAAIGKNKNQTFCISILVDK